MQVVGSPHPEGQLNSYLLIIIDWACIFSSILLHYILLQLIVLSSNRASHTQRHTGGGRRERKETVGRWDRCYFWPKNIALCKSSNFISIILPCCNRPPPYGSIVIFPWRALLYWVLVSLIINECMFPSYCKVTISIWNVIDIIVFS